MEIAQKDIFGTSHKLSEDKKEKSKPSASAAKSFPNVTIASGINELQATGDAMLIHRILQRKLIYSGLSEQKRLAIFLRILKNETSIKAGIIEPATATRDSLLAFFTSPKFI